MKHFLTLLISTVFYLFIPTEVTGQTEGKFSIHVWESIEAPGMMLQGVLIGNQNYKIGFQAGRSLMSYQEEYIVGTDVLLRFHSFKKNNGRSFIYGRIGLRYAYVRMNTSKFNHLSIRNNMGYGIELFDRFTFSLDAGIGHSLFNYIHDGPYLKSVERIHANPFICIHLRTPHIPKVFANASLNVMFRIH